jgi:cyanophycinase
MLTIRDLLVSAALASVAPAVTPAQRAALASGALVLVGGTDLPAAARERFTQLAGGADAEVVYIPTASSGIKLESGFEYVPSDSGPPAANTAAFEAELATYFGVRRVRVLHTRDRGVASSDSFVAVLRSARGVWLSGGNAGRLVDAYLGTPVVRALRDLLERGGVVGGNSAGAIIQGSFIVRGRPDKPVLVARGRDRGFGFLANTVVNPHLVSQKRENELVTVLDAHPELLGIGLDDDAAVLIRCDRLEPLTKGRVAIYDDRKHGSTWYYWLDPAQRFDLRARRVMAEPIATTARDCR